MKEEKDFALDGLEFVVFLRSCKIQIIICIICVVKPLFKNSHAYCLHEKFNLYYECFEYFCLSFLATTGFITRVLVLEVSLKLYRFHNLGYFLQYIAGSYNVQKM